MNGKKGTWLIIIIPAVLLGLMVVSFLGSSVGAKIFGGEPLGILAVHAPHPELPAEKPFEGFSVTNTMIASWLSILTLLVFFFAATRRMGLVPRGLQNFVEFFYESAADFIESTAGREYGRKFFPVCVTIFLFVLFNAWFGLIPGFETVKMNGAPLLRNANTDINVPLMLAVVSFCFVEYWGLRVHGANYLKKFFNFRPLYQGFREFFSGRIKAGLGGIAMGAVAVFTGILESLSEIIRLISFTFRLFGNMTAGMILTLVMIYLVPWVAPSVFYGLETFIGFVQAMIFGGLTLCFLVIAIASHEGESH